MYVRGTDSNTNSQTRASSDSRGGGSSGSDTTQSRAGSEAASSPREVVSNDGDNDNANALEDSAAAVKGKVVGVVGVSANKLADVKTDVFYGRPDAEDLEVVPPTPVPFVPRTQLTKKLGTSGSGTASETIEI